MTEYDAVLVLGSGVRSGGVLPSWVVCRLQRAIETRGKGYIIVLSAGTPHRAPPIDTNGFPIIESVAEARYLMKAGVPAERTLQETSSYDTIGNAYFARTIHTDPAGLSKLLVITSDFHMERTRTIFKWIFALTPLAISYQLDFEPVTDPSLSSAVLAKRAAKEADSLERVRPQLKTITTLPEFHRWLFAEHGAYKAGAEAFGATQLDADLLDLY